MDDYLSKLEKLSELKERGVLSEEEFQLEKEKILKNKWGTNSLKSSQKERIEKKVLSPEEQEKQKIQFEKNLNYWLFFSIIWFIFSSVNLASLGFLCGLIIPHLLFKYAGNYLTQSEFIQQFNKKEIKFFIIGLLLVSLTIINSFYTSEKADLEAVSEYIVAIENKDYKFVEEHEKTFKEEFKKLFKDKKLLGKATKAESDFNSFLQLPETKKQVELLRKEKQAKELAEKKAKEAEEIENYPEKFLEVKDFNWYIGGFGSIALVKSALIKNSSGRTIKDIKLKLTLYGPSGTSLGSRTDILYKTICQVSRDS